MNELEKAVRECVFDELCVFCTKRVYIHCEYMNKTKNEPICKEGKVVYDKFISGVQWQARQSPWITVADKEPDEFKNVLLSAGSCPSIFVGHFNGEDFVVANTGQIVEYFRVLHWMSIPE